MQGRHIRVRLGTGGRGRQTGNGKQGADRQGTESRGQVNRVRATATEKQGTGGKAWQVGFN